MALPKVSIEDFDNRCVEVFPNSGERCWGMAVKVIKRNGQSKNVCLAHYEQWIEQLLEAAKREDAKGGKG